MMKTMKMKSMTMRGGKMARVDNNKMTYAKWLVNSISWNGTHNTYDLIKRYSLKELVNMYNETVEKEKSCYYETLC